MNIIYSETASELVEQFYFPQFAVSVSDWEWDFTNKERGLLRDVWPILEELFDLFSPYKEKIASYCLLSGSGSILHACLLDMLKKGLAPKTVEAVYAYCLELSEDQVRQLLIDMLNTEAEPMDKASFWECLEMSSKKPEDKWHFSRFYRHPLESMKELVELSRELILLYQPYLEKGRAERQAYAKTFLSEGFLEGLFSRFNVAFDENETIYLHIVSPWIIRLSISSDISQNEGQTRWSLVASSRIDQLIESRREIDSDSFANTLKILSDATRYNVFVALTKPHAKSKDIAKDLAITGAAVSFHTQKLINAQLLVVNRDDKDIKYNPNKALLKEVIAKLETDFALGD
ncbi:TPA: winged helix-turn-helix transcriptional regulator [Streptococcus equi subsp. zooepidemicus]|uniref:ArsR/SmtB family transcription factor n=1 Tax=Streptococcus equi TaxID=1336 RepID=UPI0013F6867B|nr:winged helix-turn-helix transcriptional regulator [Streptococcus equi]MCD3407751.1 ArsR family transcriptional regulator [Streptococcus equi subsp. zooepidemicus]MCD3461291.1 ArsR family transcriptional regulator [Streptococcus equi subsp. zooepidemicus]MDI5901040.1 ArsR family transcriptional regulator [Streptococcus equi subsp. zooepidemicus]MDI5946166.1 ArsR family transcriptional regulator [Streptococcus equi subsp. zooepidemicus]MDI5957800.1 ArsR family transcriptional regulator [Strep